MLAEQAGLVADLGDEGFADAAPADRDLELVLGMTGRARRPSHDGRERRSRNPCRPHDSSPRVSFSSQAVATAAAAAQRGASATSSHGIRACCGRFGAPEPARQSAEQHRPDRRAIESFLAICHRPAREVRVMAEQQLLAGRVAVVTGAASGMGRVMARALAAAGAKIAGVDIDAAALARLAGRAGVRRKMSRHRRRRVQGRRLPGRGATRGGDLRRARYPDQLRRHQHVRRGRARGGPRQVLRGRSGRLATHPRDQLHRRVPDGAVRGRTDDPAGMGTHHQRHHELRHHAGGRTVRLRRVQGRVGSKLRELRQGPRGHRA